MKLTERNEQRVRALYRTRDLLTAIILIAALLVTYNVWTNASQIANQALLATFAFRVKEANNRIQQRMLIYEQVLRATAGLFRASDTVTRKDFRLFVDSLDLARNYPGIQGVGYAARIEPNELDRHIASVREEGFPQYTVHPDDPRDMYTAIVYLEPFSGRNLRAFGYDMYSEPTRRAAMARARDIGSIATSGKVILVQEGDQDIQFGFLIYHPIYRGGPQHASVEARRDNLVGWVYSPFRMNDFMHGLYGREDVDLDIEIYDESISDASKMYDAEPSVSATSRDRRLKSINQVQTGSRTWTVATTALPAFEENMRSDRPQLVLQAGFSMSLMLALLIWLFLDDRARAVQAANQAMQLALYDTLTGLPNRKLLEERIVQALANSRRHRKDVALLFIDLDKFKPVNDNYGHAYGDLLLKEVAKRLQACMRESDTASRMGGDEFVALLAEVEGRPAAETVATKILNELTKPYEISGHVFDISASIGVALYPDHAGDGKALMKAADLAMYDAKNSGRSTVRVAQKNTAQAA
ncbi:MAG TPA: CHASE domain-containing protein [Noviherbaspirillum sp.]